MTKDSPRQRYHSPTPEVRQQAFSQFIAALQEQASRQASRATSPISPLPNVISLNSPPRTTSPASTMAFTEQQQAAFQAMIDRAVETSTNELRTQLAEKDQQIHELRQSVTVLQTRPQPAPAPAAAPTAMPAPAPALPGIKIQPPELFTGDRAKFRQWVSQLHLYFNNVIHSHGSTLLATDRQKVLLACSFIKSPAYEYVSGIVDSASAVDPASALPELDDYTKFHDKLCQLFGPHDPKGEAQRKLQVLKQKKDTSVEQYSAEFQRWQVLTGWNDESLISHFKMGLQEYVKLLMVSVEPQPTTIYAYMTKAAEMDSRYRVAKNINSLDSMIRAVPSNSTPAPDPDAMDLSRMTIRQLQDKVPSEEWTRRLRDRACLNCGKSGHRNFNCRSDFSATRPARRQQGSPSRVASTSTPDSPSDTPPVPLSQESINALITWLGTSRTTAPSAGQSGSNQAGPSSGF